MRWLFIDQLMFINEVGGIMQIDGQSGLFS